jgi:hypothetical protein
MAYGDIRAPIRLEVIRELETQKLMGCLRGNKDKKRSLGLGQRATESRFVSVGKDSGVSMVRLTFDA